MIFLFKRMFLSDKRRKAMSLGTSFEFENLTIASLAAVTLNDLGGLTIDCSIVGIPSAVLDNLFAPIVNPSGVWADFNPTHVLWEKVVALSLVIPMECVPDEPVPSDYPDLMSPRSAIWPVQTPQ